MNDRQLDWHLHSTASDGALSPSELVELAASRDIRSLALSDHDTMDGVAEAREKAQQYGVQFVSGVEFSVNMMDEEVHILGYFMDESSEELHDFLHDCREKRLERAEMIIDRLKKLDIELDMERVIEIAGSQTAVGRPHIAKAILEKGYISSLEDAFSYYLYNNGPAYVPKMTVAYDELLGKIRGFGGLSVIAHPGLIRNEQVIYSLIAAGIDGVEVFYPFHYANSLIERFVHLATQNGLLMTGGSDFHGNYEKDYKVLGKNRIPVDVAEKLIALANDYPLSLEREEL